MQLSGAAGIALAMILTLSAQADEVLPVLKVGSETYSNVTVTSVSATDIYFNHAKGMGNAKLKNLSPELQKKFKFNEAKATAEESSRKEANAQFQARVAQAKEAEASAKKAAAASDEISYDDGDLVVNKIYARSFRGRRPPQIIVGEWLVPEPNIEGKFVIIEFWSSWAEPCRRVIPQLNSLQSKFSNRLAVIGISDEKPEEIRQNIGLAAEYFIGTDPLRRTFNSLGVEGIPHAILIDPKGYVRFEGPPNYLSEKVLRQLMEKYSE